MSPADTAAVAEANRRFYEALQSRDFETMERCWSHEPEVSCVHPGWHRLDGWDEVARSWQAIFKNSRPWTVAFEDERVFLAGTIAVVLCAEKIESVGGGEPARMEATNIFRRRGPAWEMVHHHASPSPETETEEEISVN